MIKALISDFDGTLVDTFTANLNAYQKAFAEVGLQLTEERYRSCFGLRYDALMDSVGVKDSEIRKRIKDLKKAYYPQFFDLLRPNTTLIELLVPFRKAGIMTAIASTASKDNLMNAINSLDLAKYFDLIFAGVDVTKGKPDPEIYLKTMESLAVLPGETLIFEDSETGIQAAMASGARYIRVTVDWFK